MCPYRFNYLNLDDGWSEPARVHGRLLGNKQAFPGGMKALGEYIRSKGLRFGIYADAGKFTCAGYPGEPSLLVFSDSTHAALTSQIAGGGAQPSRGWLP